MEEEGGRGEGTGDEVGHLLRWVPRQQSRQQCIARHGWHCDVLFSTHCPHSQSAVLSQGTGTDGGRRREEGMVTERPHRWRLRGSVGTEARQCPLKLCQSGLDDAERD